MPVNLAIGTIEQLVVDVSDRLDNLTTLDDATPTFDIRREYEDTYIVLDEPATADGLRVTCLIDTTSEDFSVGAYELFLSYERFPEFPRLGPLQFNVI